MGWIGQYIINLYRKVTKNLLRLFNIEASVHCTQTQTGLTLYNDLNNCTILARFIGVIKLFLHLIFRKHTQHYLVLCENITNYNSTIFNRDDHEQSE